MVGPAGSTVVDMGATPVVTVGLTSVTVGITTSVGTDGSMTVKTNVVVFGSGSETELSEITL